MPLNNVITIGAAIAGAYYVANQSSRKKGGSSSKNGGNGQMNMGMVPLPMPTPTPAPSDPEPESTGPEPPKDPTNRVEPDEDAKFSAIAEHPTSEDIFGVKSSGNIEKVADTTEHGTGGGEADYFSKY